MTIIIDGFAEWKGSGDCLVLDYWYIQDEKLNKFTALCPHGLASVNYSELVPSHHTVQHISAAIAWLEKEAIPLSEEAVSLSGKRGLDYSPSYRAYLVGYPIGEVDPWPDDPGKVAIAALKSTPFIDLIRRSFPVPNFLEDSQRVERIKQIASDFINSQEVQDYLKKKAEGMADFWVGKIGGLGSSGNMAADGFHALIRAGGEPAPESEALRFREVLVSHSLKSFDQGRVPYYDTDYGPSFEFRKVLEENGLMNLASHLPWKTTQPFDFNDAPEPVWNL
jgi:hypothetical protein